MRIALLGAGILPIPPPEYGAVERHIHELRESLQGRGHDVDVLNRVFGSEYRFVPWAVRQVRRSRPDVVHAHTSAVGASLAMLLDSLVFTSHNPAWTAGTLDIQSRWGLALERFTARKAGAFIALDGRTMERVSPYARHLYVVHGAIDPSSWERSSLAGGYVLSVGKVEPRKGFHLVAGHRDGVEYVVAGKSVGERVYEENLRMLGVRLELDPSNERLQELYARASVYVHPSSFDAFSLAVLEAMASGLPVVASPVAREQVEEGVNGYLVSGDDYREPLRRLLEDEALRRRMGEASRRRVEERFSWDVAADKVIEVYESVVESR